MRWLAAGGVAMILGAACSGSSSAPPSTTINFWYLSTGVHPDQYFQDAASAFHAAHPTFDVKGTKIAGADAYSKMLDALKGGTGPDVIQAHTSWGGAFAATGALHEFSADEVQQIGGSAAFVPAAWATSSAFGTTKTTAIPWFIDTRVIYYRTDVLQQLGIDPANGFSNWEEFDHTLNAIKISGKIAAFGIAGKSDSGIVASFAPWIWEAGGSLVSDDGTKPTINQSRSVDGADEYQRLGGRYTDPAVLKQDTAAVESMFVAGKFAITIGGPDLALKLQGSQVGVQQFPSGHAGHAVYVGGANLSVLNSSKHETGAYEWVKWLTSNEGQTSYVSRLGMYPALVDAGQSGPIKSQLTVGRSFPTLPAWPALEKSLATNLGKIWDDVVAGKEPIAKDHLQKLLDQTAGDMQTALSQP